MKSQQTEQFFIARYMLIYFAISIGHNTEDHCIFTTFNGFLFALQKASKNLKRSEIIHRGIYYR